MTPAEYGFAVGRGLQDTYSNVLMGLRENRAQQELSLRERAFMAEQQRAQDDLSLRNRDMAMRENESKIRVRQANDAYDLTEAAAFAHPEFDNQFSQLDQWAANDDLDSLKNARYKPVVLPQAGEGAFNRKTQDRLNALKSQEFNAKREALLGKSNAAVRRRENLENLIDYSTYLGAAQAGDEYISKGDGGDVLNAEEAARYRQLAAEAHALISRGVSFSELPAEHAGVLTKANQFAARQALSKDPKYQVASKLAEARSATATASGNKNKMEYFQDRLKASESERKYLSEQMAGVNITSGQNNKALDPVRSETQNFLNRQEKVRKRALARYQANPAYEGMTDKIFGEDDIIEVTYEMDDPLTGGRKTATTDISPEEVGLFQETLKQRNGRVIKYNNITRPNIPPPKETKGVPGKDANKQVNP